MNISAFLGVQRRRRPKPDTAAVRSPQPHSPAPELRPFLKSLTTFNPGEIVIRVIYVIGKQRTGKTTLVNSIVSDIQNALGEKVDYRITNDLKDVLSPEWLAVKKPVLIRLVDDAGRFQFSRRGMDQKQLSKIIDMKEIAHRAEEAGLKEGCITIFYGAQNETLVDFQLRSEAEIVIIKWLNLSIKDHRELIQGLKGFDDTDRENVEKWIDGIRMREIWALSRALVIFPTRKWGWYNYEKKEARIDQQLKHYEDGEGEVVESVTRKAAPVPIKALSSGTVSLDEAVAGALEDMKKEKGWELKARCYESVHAGATENETAIKVLGDVSKQPQVNKWKRAAQGELKRRVGAIYENVVTMRLANEGYQVQHLGGHGDPDIIAAKNNKAVAVSCKIYEDPRKVVSVEAAEFRPEINWAVKNNSEKFILFFYNLSWKKEIIREVDRDTGTVTLRLSEAS